MRKLCRCCLAVLAAAVALTGLCAIGRADEAPAPEQDPCTLSLSDRTDHPALLDGSRDGAFHPEGALTWGELARAANALADGLPQPASAMWLGETGREGMYRGAAGLIQAGILDPGVTFQPDAGVTRADLAETLDRLGLMMQGDEQTWVRAVATAVSKGALLDDPSSADSAQIVTRREAAIVLERLAGREPEPQSQALFNAGLMPSDVSQDDWAWPYMADACLAGAIPVREAGVFRMYGWLYEADENGELVRDTTDGVWAFGPDGRYTTGDTDLDEKLTQALAASGANELEGVEALQAAYLYVKDNFEYKHVPEDLYPESVGSTDWINERAARFFKYGGGTCYGYAATFGLLARALGENAYIVAAEVNERFAPHSFVVIPEDGIDWIYDVELEDARQYRHADLDLFHIQNHAIYHYWYNASW